MPKDCRSNPGPVPEVVARLHNGFVRTSLAGERGLARPTWLIQVNAAQRISAILIALRGLGLMPGEAVLRHDLSELTGCELRCRARVSAGRVLGFFLDDAGWTLRYISVALQADPPGATRLLPTATLPPVLDVEGCLHACLAPDELRRGHLLAGSGETVSRDDEQTLHDSLHWLPYWLEPGAPASGTLRDAALAIGAQLSCCGESFGVVEDMLVDTADVGGVGAAHRHPRRHGGAAPPPAALVHSPCGLGRPLLRQ